MVQSCCEVGPRGLAAGIHRVQQHRGAVLTELLFMFNTLAGLTHFHMLSFKKR